MDASWGNMEVMNDVTLPVFSEADNEDWLLFHECCTQQQEAESRQNEQASAGAVHSQELDFEFNFGDFESVELAAGYAGNEEAAFTVAPLQTVEFQSASPTTTAEFPAVASPPGHFLGATAPALPELPPADVEFDLGAYAPALPELPLADADFDLGAYAPAQPELAPPATELDLEVLAPALPAAAQPAAPKAGKQSAGKKIVFKNDNIVLEARRAARGELKRQYNLKNAGERTKMQNTARKAAVAREKGQEEEQWAEAGRRALESIRRNGGDVEMAKQTASIVVPYVTRVQPNAETKSANTRAQWKAQELKRERRFEAWQVARNYAITAHTTAPEIGKSTRAVFLQDWQRGLKSLGLQEHDTTFGHAP